MNQSGIGSYKEHHFRRVIPGDMESARRRLSDALEEFNYIVLGEQPIQARRSAQKNLMSANVLEYDMRLTIALKSISAVSTVATFNYEVPYLFTKGEKLAMEREAEAIIALATAPLIHAACPACGTENTNAVRFCRACGTPTSRNRLPAEIEVMRLTAGLSSAQVGLTTGVVILLLTLPVTLLMIMLGGEKAVKAGWVLFAIGSVLSFLTLVYNLRGLHVLLNPAVTQQDAQTDLRAASMPEREALPTPPASITESTTELIEPIAVRDTNDMD